MHNESHILLMKRETQPTVFGTSTCTLIKAFFSSFKHKTIFFVIFFQRPPFLLFFLPLPSTTILYLCTPAEKNTTAAKYYIHKQQAALIFFKAYMDKIATKRTF